MMVPGWGIMIGMGTESKEQLKLKQKDRRLQKGFAADRITKDDEFLFL